MGSFSLNQIDVAKPCSADWDAMPGTDSARFCKHCQKHVHNLSAMSTDDAERLVCQSAGSLCIRMERDFGGQLRTLSYESTHGRLRWSWRKWSVIGLCGALIAGTANAFLFGDRAMRTRSGVMMGAACPLPATSPATTAPTPNTPGSVTPVSTPSTTVTDDM